MKKSLLSTLILFFTLLLLCGCSNFGKSVKVTAAMNRAVSSSILVHNKGLYSKADKSFEAHKIYGATEKNGETDVFTYTLFETFNRSTKTTVQAGGAGPVLIKLKKQRRSYKAVNYKEAKDGSMYADSIKKMFPRRYANEAISDSENTTDLETKIQKKVSSWLK
ncbi:MAG: hypothetical protein ABF651_03960 [Sporolactobacillus sp.]